MVKSQLGRGFWPLGWTLHRRHKDFASNSLRWQSARVHSVTLAASCAFRGLEAPATRAVAPRARGKGSHTLGTLRTLDFVIFTHISFLWDSGFIGVSEAGKAWSWRQSQDCRVHWLPLTDICWQDALWGIKVLSEGQSWWGGNTRRFKAHLLKKNQLKRKWNDGGPDPSLQTRLRRHIFSASAIRAPRVRRDPKCDGVSIFLKLSCCFLAAACKCGKAFFFFFKVSFRSTKRKINTTKCPELNAQRILCSEKNIQMPALLGLWKFLDPRRPGPWYYFSFGCSDLPLCTCLCPFRVPKLCKYVVTIGWGNPVLCSLHYSHAWECGELDSRRNETKIIFNFKENPRYLYTVNIWIWYNLWGAGKYTTLHSPISGSPWSSKRPLECLKPTFTNTILNGG